MAIEQFIKKIDRLQREIDGLEPDGERWDEAYLEQLKIDFTYASNRLEGNKVSYGQTLQILHELVSPQNASLADVIDIINHKAVLDIVFENYSAEQLTESNIKKLHKELMKNPAQWNEDIFFDPGRYKKFENRTYRNNGKEHLYAAPEEVSAEMSVLIRKTNKDLQNSDKKSINLHPLAIATRFHYIFLNRIHPFGDGNGRIARIFMNLILLKAGYPPIFINEVNKLHYLETFSKEENSPGSMLEFMVERLIESLKAKKKFLTKQKK